MCSSDLMVLELLNKEVQIARAQMEIRQHVEQEMQGHQREHVLRQQLKFIQKELGITTIFVTHDQEEALAMSDRVVVMHEGKAAQVGSPFEIYTWPKTRFVASFVGTLNLLEGEVIDAGRVRLDGIEVPVTRGLDGRGPGRR